MAADQRPSSSLRRCPLKGMSKPINLVKPHPCPVKFLAAAFSVPCPTVFARDRRKTAHSAAYPSLSAALEASKSQSLGGIRSCALVPAFLSHSSPLRFAL